MPLFSSGTTFSTEYASNQGDWSNSGVPGGFDQFLAGGASDRAVTGTVLDITASPYNADPTGTADCKAALESAISDAASGDVIYFPAGTYRFNVGFIYLNYKDNITIRGAGRGVTTWYCSTPNPILVWSSPGDLNSDPLVVTGTKTKGTTALSVSSSTGYSVGQLVAVGYENEVDNARIEAGAPPVWSSGGFPFARNQLSRVTAVGSGVITISPGLPADGTDLEVVLSKGALDWKSEGIGIEDFSVEFDVTDHPSQVFNVQMAVGCWWHNVHFEDFSRNLSNGSCLKIAIAYQCEIRKCSFIALSTGVSSDGAIETGYTTGLAIVDNIFKGAFGVCIYESGNSNHMVIAYNYNQDGNLSGFHNAHPSLNLHEGNAGTTHHSDGYHGSSSNNTHFRNFYRGGNPLILNRFKRKYLLAGNIFGVDGVSSALISYGNPNMGNGSANGFAGPTGLSTRVGSPDYLQPGYGPNEYIIQAEDVAVGKFWLDWEITGVLTTRVSDTEGIFTVVGGDWFTGASPTGASVILPTVHWANKSQRMNGSVGSVTNVTGSLVTCSWVNGVLPIEGTAVQMYTGAPGWQERDLDVEASSIHFKNYWAAAVGTGAIQNGTSETFPDSIRYATKPAWFGDLDWPPYDPDAPVADATRIPAGWRAINGNEDYFDLSVVSQPLFTPAAAVYGSAQTVTLSTATSGATIRYTTDGSTPTSTTGTVYTTPISISATTTLKAIAYDGVLTDSSVRSGVYTIGVIPTAPSTLVATAVSSSQIDLTWSDNSSNETGFRIYRGTVTGSLTLLATVATPGLEAYSATGLTAGTEYFFEVVAYNAIGDSDPTNEDSATTSASSGPTAPSGLNAVAASSSQINLTWTDNSSDETGFKIYKGTVSGSLTLHATVATPGLTSYSVTGLTAATTYYFQVYAYNGGGNSSPTAEDSATTDSVSGSAYDFPASPTDNQIYVFGTKSWQYDAAITGWERLT